jgi:hypothetical protein
MSRPILSEHDQPTNLTTEGGSEHRTNKQKVRRRSLFPENTQNFYPDQLAREELTKEIISRVDRQKANRRPKTLTDLTIRQNLLTINGRNYVQLDIDFVQNNDPNFFAARVWIKGYLTGNSLAETDTTIGIEETLPYTLLSQIQKAPSSITVEKSDEEVIVGVEAINEEGIGSGLASMPTITITLDGV